MSTGPKTENRGGARPGAGRPRGSAQTLSAQQVRKMLRAARRFAIERGKTIDELLLEWIYATGDEAPKFADRIACVKLWKEYTMARMQEGGTTDKALSGPAVFLPQQRPKLEIVQRDPAKPVETEKRDKSA